MVRKRNIKNLKTEKEGIQILRKKLANFHIPNIAEKKFIYSQLGIDYKKYSRSIDGILLNVKRIKDIRSKSDLQLIEIKTTKAKNIVKLPFGVFFGITENEENLFKKLENYRLCIVHSLTKDFVILTYAEYLTLIKNKRVQYQVNFKPYNKD